MLAGKFRLGKTILITDLIYKCNSSARGLTNIQYGLDEIGYAITVIDINSFNSVTKRRQVGKNLSVHIRRPAARSYWKSNWSDTCIFELNELNEPGLSIHSF